MDSNKDLITWLNNQPAWVRVAVEIFVKKGKIDESNIPYFADICVQEAGGCECDKYKVTSTNLLSRNLGNSFALRSLSDIEGVNAIDTNKAMVFAPKGINVIYGGNGVGKSGYIRVFKMISGATYREEIKPNIYKAKKVKPKCKVTIEEDGITSILDCNLQKPGEYDVLKKIDIFDTKIAQGYVHEEKEASFEPWIFSLFSALGESAGKIKVELLNRKQSVILEEYDIPSAYEDLDYVKALKKIDYKTKIEDICPAFSEEDESILEELKSKSQTEKNSLAIKVKLNQIDNIKEVETYFERFQPFYTDENVERITKLSDEWIACGEAYKLSNELVGKNIDEIDEGCFESDSWLKLWKFARLYYDSTKKDNDIGFAEAGSRCPLCHQLINSTDEKRMKTIDEYVNGQAADSLEKAKDNYIQALVHCSYKSTTELDAKTKDLKEPIRSVIRDTNEIIIKNCKLINSVSNSPILIERVDVDSVIDRIAEVRNALYDEIKTLEKLNDEDEQKKYCERIADLELKKVINGNAKKIAINLEKIKKQHIYDVALKLTSTTKLTNKSKELAKELITDAYIERFNDELRKLSNSGLTAQIVQGKARVGKTPYRVQLCGSEGEYVSPKDILSEGESRAVALAAFFAEAAGRTETCPLIVDDPISSLDYEYESKVIARLVEAAEKRQVIVFTHRISLVVGISDQIKDKKLFNELSLKATKTRKGIPGEPDINASAPDKILHKLQSENLKKLRKMDELSEDYYKEKHYICQQFRNCVEKSVEVYLIGGVVNRFRKDVQTTRIKYLPSITHEDCDLIDFMMTKYSAYDHSMSTETPLIEFEISEIEDDMQKFERWIKQRKPMVNK